MRRSGRRWPASLVALALIVAAVTLLDGCGTTTPRRQAANVHWLNLDQVKNARDLGGWPLENGAQVPYGRVFRSGKLSSATAMDISAIRSLGVRSSIDLRITAEVKADGKDPGVALGLIRTKRAPMVGVDSEGGYRDLVRKEKSSIATVFRALADGSSYPVIIHCTAGKDRTGIVSALLLELLGVPRRKIVDEYMLSADAGEVNPDWIEAALEEIDNAGGINQYLAGIGIGSSMQEAIKNQILAE